MDIVNPRLDIARCARSPRHNSRHEPSSFTLNPCVKSGWEYLAWRRTLFEVFLSFLAQEHIIPTGNHVEGFLSLGDKTITCFSALLLSLKWRLLKSSTMAFIHNRQLCPNLGWKTIRVPLSCSWPAHAAKPLRLSASEVNFRAEGVGNWIHLSAGHCFQVSRAKINTRDSFRQRRPGETSHRMLLSAVVSAETKTGMQFRAGCWLTLKNNFKHIELRFFCSAVRCFQRVGTHLPLIIELEVVQELFSVDQ